jgi:hypothetical protein
VLEPLDEPLELELLELLELLDELLDIDVLCIMDEVIV